MKTLFSPLAILCACFCLVQQSYSQCLNGTYTVGGSNPDYTSISAIFNDLENNGVCGPVIFNFRPGSYVVTSSSSGSLDSIPGNSAQNPVTFRAENGDSSSVYLARSSFSDYIINLRRTHYVIFEYLSFRVFSTSPVNTGWNLRITFDNEYIEVRNCAFLESYQSATHYVQAHISVQSQIQDLVIENCLFEQATYAINALPSPGAGSCTIINNQYFKQDYAISIQNFGTVNIERNFFKQGDDRNLQISSVGMMNIQKNIFDRPVNLFYSGSSVAGQSSLFANNFCYGFSEKYNLFVFGSSALNIVHNTFYNTTNNTTRANLWLNTSDSLHVLNNIFVMKGLGKFVNAFDDITIKSYVFDYNGYERSGGFDFQSDTTSYSSLNQFQQATGWGMHSLLDTFVFEGFSTNLGIIDLHLAVEDSSNQNILDLGTPLAYISTDIDDDIRSSLHPDMGADEATILIPSVDLSIFGINLPDTVCPGSHEMAVSIQNISPLIAEEYDVYLAQNGQLIDSFFVRPIPFTFDTSTFIFQNGINDSIVTRKMFIPADTTLHFQIWVKMGNGDVDTVANNDTLSFSLTSTSLPQPQLPIQIDICRGDSTEISAAIGYAHYDWSTGDSSSSIFVSQSGFYRLEVTDMYGCKSVEKTFAEVNYVKDELWIARSDNHIDKVLEGNGNKVYIGGEFDLVGPFQPQLGLFDLNAEQHIPVEKLRSQSNEFEKLISDGNGGWFMATGLQVINSHHPYKIIHHDSLARPIQFNVEVNGSISDLLLHEDRLYVCGEFDTIQGQKRVGVAAIDPVTGLLLEYDPGFRSATINQLAIVDETVILAGDIFFVNRLNYGQNYTVVFTDYLSGTIQPDENWEWVYDEFEHPWPTSSYEGLFVEWEGEHLVVGTSAFFTKVLDISTQQKIFEISGLPHMMEIHQGILYLGYPDRIDQLDLSSQTLGLFVDVVDNPDYVIEDLSFTDTSVFVGGFFEIPGSNVPVSVAEFEIGTGSQTSFSCTVFSANAQKATVKALDIAKHRLIMGGDFESIGGMERKNLYEFDFITQRPTAWNPAPDSTVGVLEMNDNRLYVGGRFSEIDGQARNSFAAFDSALQLVSNLTYPITGPVFDFAFTDTSVYIAGDFSPIQQSRNNGLMAIHKQTGNILPFEVGVTYFLDPGWVQRVEVIDSVVFLFGGFTEFYDSTGILNVYFCDAGVAAADATTGYYKSCLFSSSITTPQTISDIQVYDGKLYLTGAIETSGTEPLKDMVVINPATLFAEAVNIDTDDYIGNMNIQCGNIYLDGRFSTINGEEEYQFAIMDFPPTQVYDIFSNPDQVDMSLLYGSSFVHNGRIFTNRDYHNISAYDTHSRASFVEIDISCFPLPFTSLTLDFNSQVNGLQVDLQNLSPSTGVDFQWDFGDGNTSTILSPSHTYTQVGTYTVSLYAFGECGKDTLSKEIQVGTVTNDKPLTPLFQLYPNPSTGELFVAFSHASAGPVEWQIFDQAGRLVLRQGESFPAGEQQLILDLNTWPKGMYYLVLNQSGKRQSEKFIIAR